MSGIMNILCNNLTSTSSTDGTVDSRSLARRRFGSTVLPFRSSLANAAYVIKDLVSTVCISHPHMDHIAGFVLNSAVFTRENPKTLAGLPVVVDGLKKHLFNGILWPNMSNEGADPIGVVHLKRLKEREEYEVANGLTVQTFEVSHGCLHLPNSSPKAVPSSGFFIKDTASENEILIFGDVEPGMSESDSSFLSAYC